MAQLQGFTMWFTGMLGAGKSSLAKYIAARLRQVGRNVEILDEDDLGKIFWRDFEPASKEDWQSILQRITWIAEALARSQTCVLVASTSPYKAQREEVRRRFNRYIEVFVDCPVEILIKRDTTGKYKKALSGEIPHFPGISSPYEPPSSADVTIASNVETIEESGQKILDPLVDLGLLTAEELKVITGTKVKAARKVKGGKRGKKAAPADRATVEKAAPKTEAKKVKAKASKSKSAKKVVSKTAKGAKSAKSKKAASKKKETKR